MRISLFNVHNVIIHFQEKVLSLKGEKETSIKKEGTGLQASP